MSLPDYSDYDGLGLAELVARGEVTPLELVEAAIERIERHNPTLNAVVYKAYDEARAAATGPLPGRPVPRRAVPDQGSRRVGGRLAADSHGSRFARGVVDPRGQRPDPPLSRERRGAARQDQHPRVRHHRHDGERRLSAPAATRGTPATSPAARPAARPRGGGGHRAAGPRQRRPGLDPHPGRLLRPRGPEGHPRPQPQPARRLRLRATAMSSTTSSPARCATAPPCWTSPASRAGLALSRPAQGPALSSRRSSARPGKLRIAWSAETPNGRADRPGGPGRAAKPPPTLLRASATRWSRAASASTTAPSTPPRARRRRPTSPPA